MIVLSKSDLDVFVLNCPPGQLPGRGHKSAKTGLKPHNSWFRPLNQAWCCFCSCTGMETHRWLRTTALLLLLLLSATYAQAQADSFQRVRTDSRYLRLVIASGIERSPTFRRIVDRIERSDVIVEVQCGHFVRSQRAGQTVFLSAQPGVRYVVVEIACWASSGPSLYIIGHELRHVLEIAEAPAVVDSATLAQLYRSIGYPTSGPTLELYGAFETADAIAAGERVRHELFHPEEPPARVARNATQ
jgi:hypothetical protein